MDETEIGAAEAGETMICVRNLVKRHGDLEVLRGTTLSVSRGEVAAIIGPSGSGKSTFLRCLNGLEHFDSGTISVDGLELAETLTPKQRDKRLLLLRRKVGMVFQAFNLFPHQSVLENVIEAPIQVLGLHRDQAIQEARVLLDRVGMGTRLDAHPRHLSGGQQQRVAIARALAMEPRAILFDEPTSALDPRMTNEVLSVMSDLAQEGLTMVVVTHAMKFARQVATTVHVFSGGVVVESGPAARIFDCPTQEATRNLLSEVQAA